MPKEIYEKSFEKRRIFGGIVMWDYWGPKSKLPIEGILKEPGPTPANAAKTI